MHRCNILVNPFIVLATGLNGRFTIFTSRLCSDRCCHPIEMKMYLGVCSLFILLLWYEYYFETRCMSQDREYNHSSTYNVVVVV